MNTPITLSAALCTLAIALPASAGEIVISNDKLHTEGVDVAADGRIFVGRTTRQQISAFEKLGRFGGRAPRWTASLEPKACLGQWTAPFSGIKVSNAPTNSFV